VVFDHKKDDKTYGFVAGYKKIKLTNTVLWRKLRNSIFIFPCI